jgi:hypothetical protein
VGPHSLFVGGGGPSLSVGARCLQARVGSFSSVGGCCVRGRSRSGVGVTLGVVLVGGGLLRPRALAFVGGGCSRQWGVVASVGARVRGWASRWESFSSVGGCCVRGCLRSWVGVVLVSGGLLRPWALAFEGGRRVRGRSRRWGAVMGGFVFVVAFRFPVAGVVRGQSSFVGGGRSSGVDDGGGVVLARSGCDVALPRRCQPSLRRPILSGLFWFSLTVVASR